MIPLPRPALGRPASGVPGAGAPPSEPPMEALGEAPAGGSRRRRSRLALALALVLRLVECLLGLALDILGGHLHLLRQLLRLVEETHAGNGTPPAGGAPVALRLRITTIQFAPAKGGLVAKNHPDRSYGAPPSSTAREGTGGPATSR